VTGSAAFLFDRKAFRFSRKALRLGRKAFFLARKAIAPSAPPFGRRRSVLDCGKRAGVSRPTLYRYLQTLLFQRGVKSGGYLRSLQRLAVVWRKLS